MKRTELEALIARLRARKGADARAAAAWMHEALQAATRVLNTAQELERRARAGEVTHAQADAVLVGTAWAACSSITGEWRPAPWLATEPVGELEARDAFLAGQPWPGQG